MDQLRWRRRSKILAQSFKGGGLSRVGGWVVWDPPPPWGAELSKGTLCTAPVCGLAVRQSLAR